MRFFSRRSRSRSVNRAAKSKRGRHREQQSSRTDNRTCDDSIGSELPTLDQFEIAVPSKSFQTASLGDHRNEYSPEAREDDVADNRSCTDISSITSVSYRAGYYYLRNVKRTTPERKKKTGCLPHCSCAICMPCSCSWLTCCCCHEAKTELASATTTPRKHPALTGDSQSRETARQAHSHGRRSIMPPGDLHGHSIPGPAHPAGARHGKAAPSSNRRYTMSGNRSTVDRLSPMNGNNYSRLYLPSLKRNHSLFDELSEEEDLTGYGGQRGQPQYDHQKKNKQKPWRRGRSGGGGSGEGSSGGGHGPPLDFTGRDKASRSQERQVARY